MAYKLSFSLRWGVPVFFLGVLALTLLNRNAILNEKLPDASAAATPRHIAAFMQQDTIANNILFSNRITLKDGQSQSGGQSFLLQVGDKILVASAVHLMGTALGFTEDITAAQAKDRLKRWELQSGSQVVQTDGIADAQGDLLFLDLAAADSSRYRVLQPAVPSLYKDSVYYLLGPVAGNPGSTPLHLYPLRYYKAKQNFIYMENITGQPFNGYSGAPIVDRWGGVVGILSGGGRMDSTTRVFVVVQKL